MRILPVASAFALMAVPVAAWADRAPEILNRTSKWALDEGLDACQLYARFGEGDAAVIARFARFEPGEAFDLTLMGKRMKSSEPLGGAKIDFGLAKAPQAFIPMNGRQGDYDASFFGEMRLDGWSSGKFGEIGPPITPQQEAQVTGVTVQFKGGERPFRLEFGQFGRPLAMLRQCADGLVTAWGYDLQVQQSLQRRATPRSAVTKWVTSADYPIGSLRMGQGGFVRIRLDVDAAGAISDCHVAQRTDQPEFAAAVCRAILKRGRFDPALDAHGQPVRSYRVIGFRFEIE